MTAATLNSACCLGLGGEIGSVEPGKRADLVLLAAPNLLHLVYHYGINPVAAVVKGGRVVRRAALTYNRRLHTGTEAVDSFEGDRPMPPEDDPSARPLRALLAARDRSSRPPSPSRTRSPPLDPGASGRSSPRRGLKLHGPRLGQGDEAQPGKIVEVHYIRLAGGRHQVRLQPRPRPPFTFRLGAGDAIKGWDEGLVGMKVGGSAGSSSRPSSASASRGSAASCRPNAVLIYEFELLGVR